MTPSVSDADQRWKVGALARLSGVTVRTLHHYDRIGLLQAQEQTPSGHRLYAAVDVARLYRILALRRLGFGLADIAALLDHPNWALGSTVRRHTQEIGRGIDVASRLHAHLRAISQQLDRPEPATPKALFTILEEMSMLDTPVRSTTTLLVYDDLATAHTYLTHTFGLGAGEVERDANGRAVHGELFAGDQVIWLHPAGPGYQSPRRLGAVSAMTVVAVDDVDAHYARSKEAGADIIQAPLDQSYGVREYGARDVEGHLWYFHSPLS